MRVSERGKTGSVRETAVKVENRGSQQEKSVSGLRALRLRIMLREGCRWPCNFLDFTLTDSLWPSRIPHYNQSQRVYRHPAKTTRTFRRSVDFCSILIASYPPRLHFRHRCQKGCFKLWNVLGHICHESFMNMETQEYMGEQWQFSSKIPKQVTGSRIDFYCCSKMRSPQSFLFYYIFIKYKFSHIFFKCKTFSLKVK